MEVPEYTLLWSSAVSSADVSPSVPFELNCNLMSLVGLSEISSWLGFESSDRGETLPSVPVESLTLTGVRGHVKDCRSTPVDTKNNYFTINATVDTLSS